MPSLIARRQRKMFLLQVSVRQSLAQYGPISTVYARSRARSLIADERIANGAEMSGQQITIETSCRVV